MGTALRGAAARRSMLALALRILLSSPALTRGNVRAIGACPATVHDGVSTHTGMAGLSHRIGDPYALTLWVSYADRTITFVLDREAFEEAQTFGAHPVDPQVRAIGAVSVEHHHPSLVVQGRGNASTITVALPAGTVLAMTRRWRRRAAGAAPSPLPPPMNTP